MQHEPPGLQPEPQSSNLSHQGCNASHQGCQKLLRDFEPNLKHGASHQHPRLQVSRKNDEPQLQVSPKQRPWASRRDVLFRSYQHSGGFECVLFMGSRTAAEGAHYSRSTDGQQTVNRRSTDGQHDGQHPLFLLVFQ